MAESWQMLPRLPFSVARMLLLTDGSVLACTYTDAFRTTTWHRFSPDARGNYGTGAGVPVRSMRRMRKRPPRELFAAPGCCRCRGSVP